MAMPDTARRYTVPEVLALPPDGNRYEVVDGELLVTPAPRFKHQHTAARLFLALTDYLRPLGLADCVLFSPADITWGVAPDEADELVQPDIFVVPPDQLGDWQSMARLALVAEIVSPSSGRADRVVKRRAYQRHGVPTYWVVDPDAALVEVWTPEDDRPQIVTDVLTWRWDANAPELQIPMAELFAERAGG